MKIRLQLGGENADEVRRKLEDAGFEIGDDGEYVLLDADREPGLLPVRDADGQRVSIAEDSVIFIESYGHDVVVHAADGTYLSPERLYRLAETLDSRKFIRVSNSAIIARAHVAKIRPSFSMKFVLTMSDGTQIDVTRSYYYSFKAFFGI